MVKQFCLCFVALSVSWLTARIALGVPYSYTDFTYPDAADTVLNGINNAGSLVGVYGELDVTQPIQEGYNAFAKIGANLTTLTPPFANVLGAEAAAINNQGIVVGNYLFEDDGVPYTHGFVWDGNTFEDFEIPGGCCDTAISDIDDAGTIVGFYSEDFGSGLDVFIFGFRAIPDGMGGYDFETVDLSDEDPLTLDGTFLNGRNLAGMEVASVAHRDLLGLGEDDVYGVLLPQEVDIRVSDIDPVTVSDINNNGKIVGRVTFATEEERLYEVGFLVDSADLLNLPANEVEFVDVQMPGSGCTFGETQLGVEPDCHKSVQQINDSDVIVGFYDEGDGIFRGFIGTPISALTGDYNGDGVVDAADYTVWRDAQEAGATTLTNRDPSKSGPVDEDDYVSWRANFGMTAGAGAGTSAASAHVPEPTAWALAWYALGLVICLHLTLRQHRRSPA